MSPTAVAAAPQQALGTDRKDAWWVGPGITFLVLVSFIVYAHFRLFDGVFWGTAPTTLVDGTRVYQSWHVFTGGGAHYLSPFFSPDLYAWGFPRIPFVTPALLILWAPAGFRTTCYYYRKAYYRALFASPPGCAVKSAWPFYNGETKLLLWQNLHRYFLYVALVFLVFLWGDAILAYRFERPGGAHAFGIGGGSLVLTLNAFFLSLYTFSCHCYRHVVGGSDNCFTCAGKPTVRFKIWKSVSQLNERHMAFAWVSLLWVAFTDVYVTLCARGIWTDLRLI